MDRALALARLAGVRRVEDQATRAGRRADPELRAALQAEAARRVG